MAEIMFDNRTDRENTTGMHWRRGMAISVHEDGHKWSKAELCSTRKIVKMPGVPISSPVVMRYFEPVETGEGEAKTSVRRRRYTLNLKTFDNADTTFLVEGSAKTDKELSDRLKTREVELNSTGVVAAQL